MARRLPETFLEEFLAPLVSGGEVIVGAPLDAEDLVALRAECATVSGAAEQIERARREQASLTWLYPVETPVDDQTLDLAVGMHNALFLSHPAAARLTARRSRLYEVAAFTRECIVRPNPPRDAAQLVARHTIVAPLLEIERTDVELRFWVGRRRYTGQRPPGRMLAWRGLRRIEERKNTVRWLSTELDTAQSEMVELLLWQSPLTALLAPGARRPSPGPTLLFPYLRHAAVSRRVCQQYLEQGLKGVGEALASDFWQMADDPRGRVRELGSEQLAWLLAAYHHWIPAEARGALEAVEWRSEMAARSATDEAVDRVLAGSLPLRLVAGLVQYLYAASCLGEGGVVDAPSEVDDPRDSLRSVLVASADLGLLVDITALGDRVVARRFGALIDASRATMGEAVAPLTATLKRALAA